jgi:hypothetical protein
MLISYDYTYVGHRVAQLTESLIQKLIDRYPIPGPDLDAIVRWIYDHFAELTVKAELVTEWMMNSIFRGSGRLEDIRRFENMARFYFSAKGTPKFKKITLEHAKNEGASINPKNILDFDLHDLEDIFDLYEQPEVDPRVNQLGSKLPEGAKIVYSDGNYQIVEVTTGQAACDLARGTKWCTSDPDLAEQYLFGDNYNERDTIVYPLYVVYLKGKKLAQLYLGGGREDPQLMDLRDRPIAVDEGLRDALIKSGFMDRILDRINRHYDRDLFLRFVGRTPNAYMAEKCMEHPLWAYRYARDVIRGRFFEAEEMIMNSDWARDYVAFMNRTSAWRDFWSDVLKNKFNVIEKLDKDYGQYVEK